MTEERGREALITVGTTEFNELLKELDQPNFIQILFDNKFSKLVLQIGRGKDNFHYLSQDYINSQPNYRGKFEIIVYKYVDKFTDFMKSFDLIIGHAGAGTLLDIVYVVNESLQKNAAKISFPYVMVINDTLQGNHQLELGNALAESEFFLITYPEKILDSINRCLQRNLRESCSGSSILSKFPIYDSENFKAFMEDVV
jgi:beta-1,4-N-acetylglucosaminyltransferase